MKKLIPENLKVFFRHIRFFLFSIIYFFPQRNLKIIGVTGTSGKTTTSSMIFFLLNELGVKVGVVSTLGAKAGNKIIDTGLHVTSPDSKDLLKILRNMIKKKLEYIVLESSSHALEQGRYGNLKFDFSVFTNIKKDHLDWHKSWDRYALAKARLIKKLKNKGKAFVNRDDKNGYDFLYKYSKKLKKEKNFNTYSLSEVTNISENFEGITFTYRGEDFNLPIIGSYNLENILPAIEICLSLGFELLNIKKAIANFPNLEGRMQIVKKEPFQVIINFSHNADSLEKSLKSIRNLISAKNKIICVFGSAGRRDVEKRYDMGNIAGKFADIVIVTAEDPRDESLFDINNLILKGLQDAGSRLVDRFSDHLEFEKYKPSENHYFQGATFVFDEESTNSRVDAINLALKLAKASDVVIIEGKGHEKSLCFGNTEYSYSDFETLKNILNL